MPRSTGTSRKNVAARFGLAALATTLGSLAGCDGCSSTSGGSTPDAGTPYEASIPFDSGSPSDTGPPTDSGGKVTVTPATAKVLTCDSQQFMESGGAAGGTWSVSPSGTGTISSSGDYAAPLVTPSSPSVTIAYTAGASSASASVTLGTAFVGSVDSLPIDGDGNASNAFVPLEHAFAASGTTVYAGIAGPQATNDAGGEAVLEMDLYASSDGGMTFTHASSYHMGDLFCGAIAIDAGDPSVVYMVYSAGHGDSTTNTGSTVRLAVSTDGAKTFPVEYVILDSGQGNPSWPGCPDVVSPSANDVIVTNVRNPSNNYWVGTYVSNDRGANIGIPGQEGMYPDAGGGEPYVAGTDTNTGTAGQNAIDSNGEFSPRIFTNGSGAACVTLMENASTAVMVQCSSDDGTTWSAPAMVAPGTGSNTFSAGAISSGGKNVAIAYVQQGTVEGGTSNVTFVVISKDGGATWGQPVEYPLPSWVGSGQDTQEGFLRWEGDGILWLSETVDVASAGVGVLVDKTCDFGQSWSGAVNAGAYTASGLILTGSGMSAGAYIPANAPGGPALDLIPLGP